MLAVPVTAGMEAEAILVVAVATLEVEVSSGGGGQLKPNGAWYGGGGGSYCVNDASFSCAAGYNTGPGFVTVYLPPSTWGDIGLHRSSYNAG